MTSALLSPEPAAALLEVRNLRTVFETGEGDFAAVDGVDFSVEAGRTLAIVGESGCGKSVTSLSIMGLLPEVGRIDAGTIRFDGVDLRALDAAAMRRLRGNRIAMIFQEPMTSLNPAFTIGEQIVEALLCHREIDARARAPGARGARAGADAGGEPSASTTIRTSSPAACASAR